LLVRLPLGIDPTKWIAQHRSEIFGVGERGSGDDLAHGGVESREIPSGKLLSQTGSPLRRGVCCNSATLLAPLHSMAMRN
jgi:hypothetical protein